MKKVAVICVLILGCSVVMGASLVSKPFADMDHVEKIVKAVAAFYKGCEDERASVIMAELAIVDLAKKNKKDAIPYLEKALEEIDEPGLRNFTKFLIANCHKENGDVDKAMEQIMTVIIEDYGQEEEEKD
jgi:hypothetical protein